MARSCIRPSSTRAIPRICILRCRAGSVHESTDRDQAWAPLLKGSTWSMVKEAMESIKWANDNPGAMLLTLQILNGQVVSETRTPRTITLNMQANLIDPATKLRQWTGQFRNTFVAPPAGKNGLGNEFVDNLIKIVLEQMSQGGIIALAEHKTMIPLAKI